MAAGQNAGEDEFNEIFLAEQNLVHGGGQGVKLLHGSAEFFLRERGRSVHRGQPGGRGTLGDSTGGGWILIRFYDIDSCSPQAEREILVQPLLFPHCRKRELTEEALCCESKLMVRGFFQRGLGRIVRWFRALPDGKYPGLLHDREILPVRSPWTWDSVRLPGSP